MKKQTFRRYFSILLATLTFAAALAGCAPKLMQDSVPPTPTPTPTAAPEPTPEAEREEYDLSAEEFIAIWDAVEQKIDDYSAELTIKYGQSHSSWGNTRAEFGDPWVNLWEVSGEKRQLIVTVHRKFDVERARALLEEFGDIQIVYEEPEEAPQISWYNDIAAHPDGTLELSLFEHGIEGIPAQGFWQLALTWNGEPFEFTSFDNLALEVYDEELEAWCTIPPHSIQLDGAPLRTMQTGEQHEWLMTTGANFYDFLPDRYRCIYGAYTGYDGKEAQYVYFIGEFEITEENAA